MIDYEPAASYGKVMSNAAQNVGWVVSAAPMIVCLGFSAYEIVKVIRGIQVSARIFLNLDSISVTQFVRF